MKRAMKRTAGASPSLRPSPAMAVALTALVVALSGSAYAVATINGRNLQNRSVAGKKLMKNTVTGAEVRNLRFQALTLKNGWIGGCFGTGSPAIAKSVENVVRFRGAMCRPTGTSTNSFTIPASLRPTRDQYLTVDLCNGHTGRISINSTDGEVFVQDDPTAGSPQADCFTSLAGVTYTLPY